MQACSKCNKTFANGEELYQHPCVQESLALSHEERLKRMVKSGACSQEYFNNEMAKIKIN